MSSEDRGNRIAYLIGTREFSPLGLGKATLAEGGKELSTKESSTRGGQTIISPIATAPDSKSRKVGSYVAENRLGTGQHARKQVG